MSRISPLLDISRQIHAKRLVVLTNAVQVAHSRHLQLLLFCLGDDPDFVVRLCAGPAPAHYHGSVVVKDPTVRFSVFAKFVSERSNSQNISERLQDKTHNGRQTGLTNSLYSAGRDSFSSMMSLIAKPIAVLPYSGWVFTSATSMSCARRK